jgi:hypothetical protein
MMTGSGANCQLRTLTEVVAPFTSAASSMSTGSWHDLAG